jgi:hypothetical protein
MPPTSPAHPAPGWKIFWRVGVTEIEDFLIIREDCVFQNLDGWQMFCHAAFLWLGIK